MRAQLDWLRCDQPKPPKRKVDATSRAHTRGFLILEYPASVGHAGSIGCRAPICQEEIWRIRPRAGMVTGDETPPPLLRREPDRQLGLPGRLPHHLRDRPVCRVRLDIGPPVALEVAPLLRPGGLSVPLWTQKPPLTASKPPDGPFTPYRTPNDALGASGGISGLESAAAARCSRCPRLGWSWLPRVRLAVSAGKTCARTLGSGTMPCPRPNSCRRRLGQDYPGAPAGKRGTAIVGSVL